MIYNLKQYKRLLEVSAPKSPMIGSLVIDTFTDKPGIIAGHNTSKNMDVTIAYEGGYRISIPIKEFLNSFNFIQ